MALIGRRELPSRIPSRRLSHLSARCRDPQIPIRYAVLLLIRRHTIAILTQTSSASTGNTSPPMPPHPRSSPSALPPNLQRQHHRQPRAQNNNHRQKDHQSTHHGIARPQITQRTTPRLRASGIHVRGQQEGLIGTSRQETRVEQAG